MILMPSALPRTWRTRPRKRGDRYVLVVSQLRLFPNRSQFRDRLEFCAVVQKPLMLLKMLQSHLKNRLCARLQMGHHQRRHCKIVVPDLTFKHRKRQRQGSLWLVVNQLRLLKPLLMII